MPTCRSQALHADHVRWLLDPQGGTDERKYRYTGGLDAHGFLRIGGDSARRRTRKRLKGSGVLGNIDQEKRDHAYGQILFHKNQRQTRGNIRCPGFRRHHTDSPQHLPGLLRFKPRVLQAGREHLHLPELRKQIQLGSDRQGARRLQSNSHPRQGQDRSWRLDRNLRKIPKICRALL